MHKATAVFIHTESGDYYLYNFQGHLTREEALAEAEKVCDEYPEHWCEVLTRQTEQVTTDG